MVEDLQTSMLELIVWTVGQQLAGVKVQMGKR